MVRLGQGAPPKVRKEANLEKLVERSRFSIPVMRATVTDSHLRNLLLAQLIAMNVREQKPIVMPEGTLAHLVNTETFDSYRDALGGLNAKNKEVVEQKLSELGIDGRG